MSQTPGPRCARLQNANRFYTCSAHYAACGCAPTFTPSCHPSLLSIFPGLVPVPPPAPSLLDLLQRDPPTPLKVPFSLVLMADRLWPHSLSAAACPHCVPLSARQRVGGGQTASPNRMPDMDVWAEGGGTSAPRAEPSSTCNSPLPYASSVRGRERHGPGVLVALCCLFNS